MNECYKCGAKNLRRVARMLTRKIAGHAFRAKVPALECVNCGEVLYGSKDLGRFDDAVAMMLVDAGITEPQAVKFIRKAIGLPAQELAALLGVRPETISRWENGKRAIDRATFVLLRQLFVELRAKKRLLVEVLQRLQHPRKLGRSVTLKLAA